MGTQKELTAIRKEKLEREKAALAAMDARQKKPPKRVHRRV